MRTHDKGGVAEQSERSVGHSGGFIVENRLKEWPLFGRDGCGQRRRRKGSLIHEIRMGEASDEAQGRCSEVAYEATRPQIANL